MYINEINITLKWMPEDHIDGKLTLVHIMAWCCQATGHYPCPTWWRSMSPYDVTRPQWVNSSPPSVAYMCQWTGSALVQVMACRLFSAKPSPEPILAYYQFFGQKNVNEIRFEIQNSSFLKMHLKMSSAKLAAISSRGKWAKVLTLLHSNTICRSQSI